MGGLIARYRNRFLGWLDAGSALWIRRQSQSGGRVSPRSIPRHPEYGVLYPEIFSEFQRSMDSGRVSFPATMAERPRDFLAPPYVGIRPGWSPCSSSLPLAGAAIFLDVRPWLFGLYRAISSDLLAPLENTLALRARRAFRYTPFMGWLCKLAWGLPVSRPYDSVSRKNHRLPYEVARSYLGWFQPRRIHGGCRIFREPEKAGYSIFRSLPTSGLCSPAASSIRPLSTGNPQSTSPRPSSGEDSPEEVAWDLDVSATGQPTIEGVLVSGTKALSMMQFDTAIIIAIKRFVMKPSLRRGARGGVRGEPARGRGGRSSTAHQPSGRWPFGEAEASTPRGTDRRSRAKRRTLRLLS